MSRVVQEMRQLGDGTSLAGARRNLAWLKSTPAPCGHVEPFGTIVGCSVNEEQMISMAESEAANEIVQASGMLYRVFGTSFGRDTVRS